MIKTTLQRGFTLIELLVVIAIIGILAAVVIGSLNDARSTGQDASVKQTMANVRQQAEIVYNQNSFSYTTVCSADRVNELLVSAAGVLGNTTGSATSTASSNSDTTPTSRTVGCNSVDTQWAAAAPLTADDYGAYWCVDSTGSSKQVTTVLALDETVCPGS